MTSASIEIAADVDDAAHIAARRIAAAAREAVAHRGRFVLAVSGGSTPGRMLRALAREALPWQDVHLFQVDERLAPEGHEDRNWTMIRAALDAAPIPADRLHAMPVEDPETAAPVYETRLRRVAGSPPRLDLVHLGLGTDGHTASLVPNDPVLDVVDAAVALTTTAYQGRRRLTLTRPTLARARRLLWLVTGEDKAEMLPRLVRGDASMPAGLVWDRDRSLVVADGAAAGSLAPASEQE